MEYAFPFRLRSHVVQLTVEYPNSSTFIWINPTLPTILKYTKYSEHNEIHQLQFSEKNPVKIQFVRVWMIQLQKWNVILGIINDEVVHKSLSTVSTSVCAEVPGCLQSSPWPRPRPDHPAVAQNTLHTLFCGIQQDSALLSLTVRLSPK